MCFFLVHIYIDKKPMSFIKYRSNNLVIINTNETAVGFSRVYYHCKGFFIDYIDVTSDCVKYV